MTCEEKIYSEDYLDIVGNLNFVNRLISLFTDDFCYQEVNETIGFASASRQYMPIYNIAEFGYSYVPKVYSILSEDIEFDMFNLEAAGILNVQAEPYNLTGNGVVMGFLDTGIDYTLPVFKKEDGTTRILGIWDQTLPGGKKPEGFLYGTEFTKTEINLALQSDNPYEVVPSIDENGHGTAVASIAAGSNINDGRTFLGAAPNSEIVVVKLKQAKKYLNDFFVVKDDSICFQETDILAALSYLDSYAVSLQKPLVICFALGTNFGGHTGNSQMALQITKIASEKSRGVVIASGNEGIAAHHYRGNLSIENKEDIVEINVEENNKGFVVELWGIKPYLFTVKVKSPLGEETASASLRIRDTQSYFFIKDKTKITADISIIEDQTGNQLIGVGFENPTKGIWKIIVMNVGNDLGGTFDMYLPIQEFLSTKVYFVKPELNITLTNPAYSRYGLSVVPYDVETGSRYVSAGRGFSVTYGIKPDVAVPGVNIPAYHQRNSGSSYCAAIAAGGVAQLMEWAVIEKNDLLIDANQINNYLIRGAIRENDLEYPCPDWGYGKYNVAQVFEFLSQII